MSENYDLQQAERDYRLLASCEIPLGECPWTKANHNDAEEIVCMLDARDGSIKKLETERDALRDELELVSRAGQVMGSAGLAYFEERNALKAERDALQARLHHDCEGCPGCPDDCPDALDVAAATIEKFEADRDPSPREISRRSPSWASNKELRR